MVGRIAGETAFGNFHRPSVKDTLRLVGESFTRPFAFLCSLVLAFVRRLNDIGREGIDGIDISRRSVEDIHRKLLLESVYPRLPAPSRRYPGNQVIRNRACDRVSHFPIRHWKNVSIQLEYITRRVEEEIRWKDTMVHDGFHLSCRFCRFCRRIRPACRPPCQGILVPIDETRYSAPFVQMKSTSGKENLLPPSFRHRSALLTN